MSRSKSTRKGVFSFAEQRKLMEMASHGKSTEETSKLMGRPSETIRRLASRLGIYFRSGRQPASKAKS
jgi:hypothetical protein